MNPGTSISKADFSALLIASWRSKQIPLRHPVFPETWVKYRGESRMELGFLLGEEPTPPQPLILRFKYTDGRMESSRDQLIVEFGEWKRIPDIYSAYAEMDTFIADFECARD